MDASPSRLRMIEPTASASASAMPSRNLSAIALQPAFMVAVMSSAFGYGVMNLFMAGLAIWWLLMQRRAQVVV